ncbi:YpmS family protein [Lactobacillus sp. YT155]|uniref:YpmS family protein n=1 Tax=Lactobacillus sp. YT155 TaxID=3060955 RepID=UPI00265FEBD4|nr:YpmS family protein [Lactobacillus sp. YT155]MDO1605394.1 YpmS family protein [Lactobacillus sp. YT155]
MKNRNWWKISFITLLTVVVITLAWFGYTIMRPVSIQENTTQLNAKDSVFTVSLRRDQVNNLSRNYLNELLENDDIKYQVTVDKKYVNIKGNVAFLGSKVGFKLKMLPKMEKNGDVLLTAKQLKIGSLDVPMKFVMDYIGKEYHLPSWVQLDSKKKVFDLQITKFQSKTGFSFKAKKIDLKNDSIKIEVFKRAIKK